MSAFIDKNIIGHEEFIKDLEKAITPLDNRMRNSLAIAIFNNALKDLFVNYAVYRKVVVPFENVKIISAETFLLANNRNDFSICFNTDFYLGSLYSKHDANVIVLGSFKSHDLYIGLEQVNTANSIVCKYGNGDEDFFLCNRYTTSHLNDTQKEIAFEAIKRSAFIGYKF